MHLQMFLFQLCVGASMQMKTEPFEIDLYSDFNHSGKVTTIRIDTCSNLDSSVINTTSSVHTQRHCIRLYDQLNCAGNAIQKDQRSPWPKGLLKWNFEDRTQSVGICHDPCIPEIGSTYLQLGNNPSSFPNFPIKFFSEPGFQGEAFTIEVNGCTRVSTFLPKSVILPKNRCVLVFFSGLFSAGKMDDNKETCTVDTDYSLLEFRYGMPNIDNISQYSNLFDPPKTVRAVSPCSCKFPTGVYWEWEADLPNAKENYIILFQDYNFLNKSIIIPLNFSECKSFSAEENYKEWDAIAKSIHISDGGCLMVYKNSDCMEYTNSEMIVTSSIPFLFYYNLADAIRSVRVCNASDYEFEELDNSDKKRLALYYYSVTVACISSVVSLVITIILIQMWWQNKSTDKNNVRTEKLSEKEINEFIKGLGLKFDGEIAQGQDTEKEQVESKISSDLLAQNQPYDSQLEISANELTFDHKCPIGSGQFGTVLKATFKRPEPSLTVAVKTAKPNLNAQYLRTLLKEVKIMMYVGQHPKIVGLLGCCTANLRKGELFLVLEYCENGSLEKFLKANRARFVNIVEKGILHAYKWAASDYLKIILGLELPTPLQSDSTDIFDIYRLIAWSIEIVEGMEYLATKKVVHGDLSARNVLVTADGKAKVADFGLSKTIYHYTHYAKNGREPLPWRWMALESLKNSSFSTASDVWSFGVLMWEIFTLAEQPYPGVSSLTSNFVQNLEQGLRPTFPPFATSEIYNIMSCCWDEDPKRRPLFSRLLCSLMEIQSECREKTSRRASSDSDYFE